MEKVGVRSATAKGGIGVALEMQEEEEKEAEEEKGGEGEKENKAQVGEEEEEEEEEEDGKVTGPEKKKRGKKGEGGKEGGKDEAEEEDKEEVEEEEVVDDAELLARSLTDLDVARQLVMNYLTHRSQKGEPWLRNLTSTTFSPPRQLCTSITPSPSLGPSFNPSTSSSSDCLRCWDRDKRHGARGS
eukprot:evm.model.NODE_18127_length_6213_cov_16.255592.1